MITFYAVTVTFFVITFVITYFLPTHQVIMESTLNWNCIWATSQSNWTVSTSFHMLRNYYYSWEIAC